MDKYFQLFGPIVTALIFIVGLFLLNKNARLDIRKDFAIKIRSLQIENIAKATICMENIRILHWKLVIHNINLNEPLEKDAENIVFDIGKLRGEWFSSTLFLPETLKNEIDSLNKTFTNLTDVLIHGENFEQKKEANDQAHQLISDWRIKAENYIKNERIRVSKFIEI